MVGLFENPGLNTNGGLLAIGHFGQEKKIVMINFELFAYLK